MRKSIKIWLIIATCFVVAGLVCVTCAMAAVGFDIKKLATISYQENTIRVNGEFDRLEIDVNTADIELVKTDKQPCRIEYCEPENVGLSADVNNRTLTIREKDQREWLEKIGLSFDRPKIKICLPKEKYDDAAIKTVSGDVKISDDLTFGSLTVEATTADIDCGATVTKTMSIHVTTGDIRLEKLTADDLEITAVTGDIEIISVKAEKLRIETTTGDVRFDRSDAKEIVVTTTTGDVTGSLLSAKRFDVQTTTGDIDVPSASSGGSCKITTTTGDIQIKIA